MTIGPVLAVTSMSPEPLPLVSLPAWILLVECSVSPSPELTLPMAMMPQSDEPETLLQAAVRLPVAMSLEPPFASVWSVIVSPATMLPVVSEK